jgi:hypothetical protein
MTRNPDVLQVEAEVCSMLAQLAEPLVTVTTIVHVSLILFALGHNRATEHSDNRPRVSPCVLKPSNMPCCNTAPAKPSRRQPMEMVPVETASSFPPIKPCRRMSNEMPKLPCRRMSNETPKSPGNSLAKPFRRWHKEMAETPGSPPMKPCRRPSNDAKGCAAKTA